MSVLKTKDQGTIVLDQQDYWAILIESFLIDRRAQGLSPDTISFYKKKLKYFHKYCEGQALTQISQLTPDLIRRHILELSETHNPGGVHACFRPLQTLLYWIEEEEILPQNWKIPIRRLKAPKLPTEPIEPMLFLTMGDLTGALDVVAVPDTHRIEKGLLNSNSPILVTGTMEMDTLRCELYLRAEKVDEVGIMVIL